MLIGRLITTIRFYSHSAQAIFVLVIKIDDLTCEQPFIKSHVRHTDSVASIGLETTPSILISVDH